MSIHHRPAKNIVLDAMKKELARLQRIADKAKAECDEYISIGQEAFAIHDEFAKIVNSKEIGQHVIKKLDELKKRREKVDKVLKKDFVKLTDNQFRAEMEVMALASEISHMGFRARL